MEVITYGGGEFIRDMFNAVAAIVGGGPFLSALRLAFTLGLLFAIFHTAFSMNLMTTIRWFVTSLVIYLVMIVPKVDVQVIDRFDPALPGGTVSNVPIGLALIASITSTVGDNFTNVTETAFSLPNDLEYQQNGFIYGSKIFKDSMSFQVTEATFGQNLSGYVRTCVFYDLLEHRYSVTDLRETNNLWTFITVTHTPNPARFYEWVNGPGATVVKSCEEAANDLDPLWTGEVNRIATIYGKQIAPNLTEAAAQTLVLNSLAESHDFFLGSAQAASDTIRQATLGNLIDKSVRDQGAELGAEALLDAYGQARMESEMAHAIRQGSRLAERFVPLFRTVAEALFYGLFPVLFPLFLLPMTGEKLLRGYAGGFVTLMAWGPLYVILHRIMMGTAGLRSLGASYTPSSGEAVTLVTQQGIEAVHSDIAMIAGYLTLMIPFAAARLGQGAMAFAGLSQSFLHPAQMAAQSAAREVSTGNISLGNTGFNTHRFNTTEGNRHATSGFVDAGEGSWNTPEGGRMRVTAGGARVYDGMGAISRGAAHVDYQSGLSTALQSEASWSLEQRDAAAQRSSQANTALTHDISDLTWQMSQGRSFEDVAGYSIDTRASEGVNRMVSNASRFAERFTEQKDMKMAVEAYASMAAKRELGLPLIGGAEFEAGVRGSTGWEARRSEIYEAARDAVLTDTSNTGADKIVGTVGRGSTSESGGKSTAWREAFAANYQESVSASQDQESYSARADTARELSSQIERDGSNLTMNWDNAFLDHMAGQDRGDGHTVGIAEATRRWTSGELADQIWVEGEAREFIGNQADHLLDRPDLAGWERPSGASLPDVRSGASVRMAAEADFAEAAQLRDEAESGGYGSPVFDETRADQIEGTREWTRLRHEMSLGRQSGDTEELARLRKLTTQSRVQDSRDSEWDEFASGDRSERSDEEQRIWEKSRRVPGIGPAPVDGLTQRLDEERMPDRQSFGDGDSSHYETGAERIKKD